MEAYWRTGGPMRVLGHYEFAAELPVSLGDIMSENYDVKDPWKDLGVSMIGVGMVSEDVLGIGIGGVNMYNQVEFESRWTQHYMTLALLFRLSDGSIGGLILPSTTRQPTKYSDHAGEGAMTPVSFKLHLEPYLIFEGKVEMDMLKRAYEFMNKIQIKEDEDIHGP
jgi:hypothetical protein